MGFIDDFKRFAVQGNMVDMAVGIIIGGAFGKIITSLVGDVIMPPLALLTGGVNFTDLKVVLKAATTGVNGKPMAEVALHYGNFIQHTFDFLIIALSIFMVIRLMSQVRLAKKREEKQQEVAAEAVPTREEVLLTEIRDLLKSKAMA